jgi:tRNA-binding protein
MIVDFGTKIGSKKSSAQIAVHYAPDALIGRQIAAVINFPPKQIGEFMSECPVLGFPDKNGEVVLIRPDREVPNGARLF